jgi:acyl-CoA hydrolase
MRLHVDTWGENLLTGERRFCTQADLVFVAMGPDGRPTPVPPLAAPAPDGPPDVP